MKAIAQICSPFPEKFGIPRQSGLVEELEAQVVFAPEYRDPEAVRGLEEFSHIWLLWEFSQTKREDWSPTVRPPRLGGTRRLGVFATRSPYRPNPIGLSCVRLERVEPSTPRGPILHVRGADLMDATPIYDIKPYLPYADCHPEAVGGFAARRPEGRLEVHIPAPWLERIAPEDLPALQGVLAQDPRPAYHHDPQRVYGLTFHGLQVRFQVDGQILTVCAVE